MATVYGSLGNVHKPFYSDKGNVCQVYATYTCSSTASGTEIYMIPLPKGAIVTDTFITHDAMGTSVTLSQGTSSSNTRYRAATSASSAAVKVAGNTNLPDSIDSDNLWYVVAVGGATANGVIKACVTYIML